MQIVSHIIMENLETQTPTNNLSSEEILEHSISCLDQSKLSHDCNNHKPILKPKSSFTAKLKESKLKKDEKRNARKQSTQSTIGTSYSSPFLNVSITPKIKSVSFIANNQIEEVECWKELNVIDDKYKDVSLQKQKCFNEECCLCKIW